MSAYSFTARRSLHTFISQDRPFPTLRRHHQFQLQISFISALPQCLNLWSTDEGAGAADVVVLEPSAVINDQGAAAEEYDGRHS